MQPRSSIGLSVRSLALAAFLGPLMSSAADGVAVAAPPGAYAFNAYLAPRPDFTLPFYSFNGHILIDGAVDGRRGKFLFDTGTEFPFFLNNHYLPLGKDQQVGQGHAASGQAITVYRQQAPVAHIEIAGQIRFENAPAQVHTDWGFIEDAYTPHFLGSIGHGFNRNYLFVIDYEAQTIAFHSLDQAPEALARVIDPARVVATLCFTPTGVDGKLPEVSLQVGEETIAGFFDTGNLGSLQLTAATKARLQRAGLLSLEESDYTYGSYVPRVVARLSGLSHASRPLHEAGNLDFELGESNRVGLGYHFLKHYVSVWDYRRRTLTLLRR